VLITAGAILILSFSQPELLTGSLRKNIDLLEQYDDATLNNALRTAGLFALQSETDERKLDLDSEIASGGGNLSVGQRQILALGGYPLMITITAY
jgi:ABC-type multidrug transport system fused ATPase/permease subunit